MSSPFLPVTDQTLSINGLLIRYRDWDNPQRSSLVVLHGLGAHARSWDHVVAALTDHYRVIIPDLRGHGYSSWAPDYAWQHFLEDAPALINALGVSPTVLCGHSLGVASRTCWPASILSTSPDWLSSKPTP
jgi:pimeloyl-ACP methyl ester carboxylesterase